MIGQIGLIRPIRCPNGDLKSRCEFTNIKNVFWVWGFALALVLALAIAGNVALGFAVTRWRDTDPRFLLQRANALMAGKDYVGASAQIQRALGVAPDMPEVHLLDGDIHYDLKQWSQALDAYRKAQEKGSKSQKAYGRILWCLMNLNKFKEAADFGQDAISQGQGLPLLYGYTAEAFLQLGRNADAIPLLESALAHSPHDLNYLHRLEQAYRATGQSEKAAAVFHRIQEADTALKSGL